MQANKVIDSLTMANSSLTFADMTTPQSYYVGDAVTPAITGYIAGRSGGQVYVNLVARTSNVTTYDTGRPWTVGYFVVTGTGLVKVDILASETFYDSKGVYRSTTPTVYRFLYSDPLQIPQGILSVTFLSDRLGSTRSFTVSNAYFLSSHLNTSPPDAGYYLEAVPATSRVEIYNNSTPNPYIILRDAGPFPAVYIKAVRTTSYGTYYSPTTNSESNRLFRYASCLPTIITSQTQLSATYPVDSTVYLGWYQTVPSYAIQYMQRSSSNITTSGGSFTVTGTGPIVVSAGCRIVTSDTNGASTSYDSALVPLYAGTVGTASIGIPRLTCTQAQLAERYDVGTLVIPQIIEVKPPGSVRELKSANTVAVVDNSVTNAPRFSVTKGGVVSVSIRAGSGGYYSPWLPLYVTLTANTLPTASPVLTCTQSQLSATYVVGAVVTPQVTSTNPSDADRQLQSDNDTVVVDNSNVSSPKFTVVKGGVVSVSIRAGSGGQYSAWLPLYVTQTASTRPAAIPVLTCMQSQLLPSYTVGAEVIPQVIKTEPADAIRQLQSDNATVVVDNSVTNAPRFSVVTYGIVSVSIRIGSGGYFSDWLPLYATGTSSTRPIGRPLLTCVPQAQLAAQYYVDDEFTLQSSTVTSTPNGATFEFQSTSPVPATDSVTIANSATSMPKFTVVRGGPILVSVAAKIGAYYSDWLPLYVSQTATTRPTAYPVLTCAQSQLSATYTVGTVVCPQVTSARPSDAVA